MPILCLLSLHARCGRQAGLPYRTSFPSKDVQHDRQDPRHHLHKLCRNKAAESPSEGTILAKGAGASRGPYLAESY